MHGLYKVYEKTRMILYLGKVFLQWQIDITFLKGPQLLHILRKAKGFFQAFCPDAWPTLLRVPNGGIVYNRAPWAQGKRGSPGRSFRLLLPFRAFRGPRLSTFFLLGLGCLGFFGWGLLGRMSNLSFFSTFRAFASLTLFPLFVCNVTWGHTRRSRG